MAETPHSTAHHTTLHHTTGHPGITSSPLICLLYEVDQETLTSLVNINCKVGRDLTNGGAGLVGRGVGGDVSNPNN